ncbi:uncharacterized protein LOC129319386 [Prosopis cineraria]|uniref:uncharacterized protein LOC129319386 n=1 Tax=Prosopis cineraria TaxID=364024 RepID=UPI0024106E63|nr:uncharacterized protein LOC129319386 [Prosopis cineraria]XP_054820414.1 uncharacterized protein LOC129319386 [Prosopis cineraria]
MDHKSVRDVEVDLEIGLTVNEDDSQKFTPSSAGKGKTLFAKFSGDYITGDEKPSSYCSESNLSGVPMVDVLKVTSMSVARQDLVDSATKTVVKEKLKKSSNKKAPKPPRPPRAPSLDAADQKLIRDITELAMLKRARIERMKALKKMKAVKSTSSSSSIFSMVFTIVFFIVIIFQGMSSGKSSVASFQESPVPAGGIEGGTTSLQHQLNPAANYLNAPGSEYYNFVQPIANSYLPAKQPRDAG